MHQVVTDANSEKAEVTLLHYNKMIVLKKRNKTKQKMMQEVAEKNISGVFMII